MYFACGVGGQTKLYEVRVKRSSFGNDRYGRFDAGIRLGCGLSFQNFYFETGDFSQPHGFEDVCSKLGSERMLYGTNFPTNAMAGSAYTLLKAKISEEDRENIAHRNLERLLSEVKL